MMVAARAGCGKFAKSSADYQSSGNHDMTMTRRGFLSASAAFAATPALRARAWAAPMPRDADIVVIGAGAAGIAAARRIMAANRRVIVVEAAGQIGGRCLTDTATFDVPFDRGARWMHNPDTNPMIRLARSAGLDISAAPPGQKIRIGRRNARPGETEEFLAALVRANRAIDDASRGRADVSCASVLPKDLGDWAGMAEFVLGASATGKDLKDLSVIDKVRAQERNAVIACRQGLGTLIAKLGEQLPLSLSTPASRISWSNRDVTVETPAGKIAARAAVITVSSNVLAAGNIKFAPDIPKRHLDAAAKLSLGSYDHIALQLPGNPLGLARDEIIIEQSNSTRTALLFANMGSSSLVLDRCRRLVRPRPLRAGRKGDDRLRRRMADKTVRQRSRIRRQEIQRNALERRTVRARRDVGGHAGRAALAKDFVGADRLHVSRGRSHPRDPVGHGRWRLGKRRARGGGGAAKDRRARDQNPRRRRVFRNSGVGRWERRSIETAAAEGTDLVVERQGQRVRAPRDQARG